MHRGTKPKPTRLKLLAGNPGKRPLNEREPQFQNRMPPPPSHLDRLERQEWKRMCELLAAARILTEADRDALAVYSVIYTRWAEAEREIKKNGPVVKVGNSIQLSPYLTIANRCMEQMLRLWAEFGLTPSSRTRIIASPASEDYEEKRKAEKHLGPQFIRPTPPR